jgi:pimeloyl-ACP methyl ester carboxylesterase
MFEQIKLHRFLSAKIMTSIIRLSLIGMIVASFVGVGILSAQSSLVSKARPGALAKNTRRPAQAAAAPTVRNVVLVHGAFADGSSWAKVIPLLEAKGLHVTAVQNPLSSLADDVAATKRAIANQDGPVILVGHSWAGMVISEAGNDPKVAGLVYVAAIVPDENQSAADVLKPYSPPPGLAEAKPDAAGFLSLNRKGIDEDFVPDLRPAERAIIYATQGAWNSACLADKVSVPAWTTKPSWFIVAANDRMLPPDYEQAVAEHIHATTTTLDAGHVPMLSSPKQVAAVIIEAANTPFTALDAAHASAQSLFPANFRTQEIQADGATIHVRVGGQGPAVVLLHGFGDTGDMWALMAAELAHDHRVVVPDLRGMGLSSHPAGGYEKKTQAADIRSVLTQLGIDRAAVVGHDIGATVAYAYAARYPDKTDRLVVMDAPVPGIPPWDEIVRSPALWHFSFGGPDAERLVAGRERIYLDRFWNEFAGDPSKIDEATRVHYTAFYAQPGAMHSAFAQFLSIPKDAEDNKVSMTTKLTMPVLAIGGAKSFGANVAIVMRNAADNVTEVMIANSGHWLMEEQPAATIAAVHNFLDRKTTTQSH